MTKNPYTLITGASEGLGKALALECAKRHMNLLLVALPGSGLNELAAFIKKNFHVSVLIYETDLTESSSCRNLFHEAQRRNLRIHMLVNNAGLGSTLPFDQGSLELYESQIKLNVVATTLMTRLFLELLAKNKNS